MMVQGGKIWLLGLFDPRVSHYILSNLEFPMSIVLKTYYDFSQYGLGSLQSLRTLTAGTTCAPVASQACRTTSSSRAPTITQSKSGTPGTEFSSDVRFTLLMRNLQYCQRFVVLCTEIGEDTFPRLCDSLPMPRVESCNLGKVF